MLTQEQQEALVNPIYSVIAETLIEKDKLNDEYYRWRSTILGSKGIPKSIEIINNPKLDQRFRDMHAIFRKAVQYKTIVLEAIQKDLIKSFADAEGNIRSVCSELRNEVSKFRKR
jgi:hypothetical protein